MKNDLVIKLENVTKSFGDVIANDNVSLDVKRGEILALLGENGSGKSTLMNMLSGIYLPDSGSIFIEGQKIDIKSPEDSIKLGIGMIHQHFKLVDVLTARENIVMGHKGSFLLSDKKTDKLLNDVMEKYGLFIELDKRIKDMTVGEKQTLEIIKVLYSGAKILILDEPTAVLTPQEIEKLFEILNNMKRQNQTIIIITHKLNEVMEISDRVAVLRKGKHEATIDLNIKRIEQKVGKRVLECKGLTVIDNDKVKKLKNVDFDLFEGEILGVAGVSNSGQKELCEAIAGLQNVAKGEINYEGNNIVGKNPREIMKMGISMSFIPEDRLGMGLVADMDMVDNLMLKDYYIQEGLILNRKYARDKATKIINRLDITTPGMYQPVKKMSGGNIQKVLLGRELDISPHVLITAYPVRGLDIGSSLTIFDMLNEQKTKGVGILFIAEDLDMLTAISDRIMVLCDGIVTGIVDAHNVTKDQLGLLMTGEVQMYV
ncbi:ABC transporter ATP-binding protein, partial [archaeon]|nr:ABC transporter ATP-binding protein [archaeon]